MLDISKLGKGAVKTPKAVRDMHFRIMPMGAPVIDWANPYKVAVTPTQRDQNGSSSCTGQATAYYSEVLNKLKNQKDERYSARYIYSQASLGFNQGAYIWKAMSIPLNGIASLASVPEGDSSETIMTDRTLNPVAVIEATPGKYAVIPRSNIDQMAQVIKDFGGFVTGFNGHNGMFNSKGQVVDWSKVDWGHAVYVYGFEKRNGVKCLRFRNSWSANWGTNGDGFFPEAFVDSGMLYDCYTYAEIADLDPSSVMLTEKQVRQLQALEGYKDEDGVAFWTGKLLSDYLAARLPDKVKTINESL